MPHLQVLRRQLTFWFSPCIFSQAPHLDNFHQTTPLLSFISLLYHSSLISPKGLLPQPPVTLIFAYNGNWSNKVKRLMALERKIKQGRLVRRMVLYNRETCVKRTFKEQRCLRHVLEEMINRFPKGMKLSMEEKKFWRMILKKEDVKMNYCIQKEGGGWESIYTSKRPVVSTWKNSTGLLNFGGNAGHCHPHILNIVLICFFLPFRLYWALFWNGLWFYFLKYSRLTSKLKKKVVKCNNYS